MPPFTTPKIQKNLSLNLKFENLKSALLSNSSLND